MTGYQVVEWQKQEQAWILTSHNSVCPTLPESNTFPFFFFPDHILLDGPHMEGIM